MSYLIVGLVCLIIGYYLGQYRAEILKRETYKAWLVINDKIEKLQQKLD